MGAVRACMRSGVLERLDSGGGYYKIPIAYGKDTGDLR